MRIVSIYILLLVTTSNLCFGQYKYCNAYTYNYQSKSKKGLCYEVAFKQSDSTYLSIYEIKDNKTMLYGIEFKVVRDSGYVLITLQDKIDSLKDTSYFLQIEKSYFPVIINKRLPTSRFNSYDLLVTNESKYQMLFYFPRSDKPYVVLAHFLIGDSGYFLSSLQEPYLSRHIDQSVSYWLSREKTKDDILSKNEREN